MNRVTRTRTALLLSLTLALTACGGGAADRDENVDRGGGDRAARAVERFVDARWPADAGGTVLAARGADLVACVSRGHADRERRRPARCATVYDIGSMTKQFTAAAVLRLRMEGSLRVTDRLGRFFADVPRDKRGITLHHLLTHTAGLPEQLGDDYDPVSRDELVAAALATRLRSAPGSAHAYSNLGYSLLAAVVEKASGMGYEEYLADRLFTPVGMTRTGYVLPAWRRDRIAVEYDRRGRPHGTPLDHPWADDGPYWNLRGNGGMLSTARDMLRWHRALLGDRVLDARARKQLLTPHVAEGEGSRSFYGYGWSLFDRSGTRIATHDGGNGMSAGRVTRFLGDDVLVFWISNHATRAGEWNIPRLDPGLTLGVAERAGGRL